MKPYFYRSYSPPLYRSDTYPVSEQNNRVGGVLLPFVGGLLVGGLFAPRPNYGGPGGPVPMQPYPVQQPYPYYYPLPQPTPMPTQVTPINNAEGPYYSQYAYSAYAGPNPYPGN